MTIASSAHFASARLEHHLLPSRGSFAAIARQARAEADPVVTEIRNGSFRREGNTMDLITRVLVKLGILKQDLDYHLIRTSMVIIFLFFGYQKWFDYEAQALIPYISHGPLVFWLYPVFGIRGACWFLGVAEWFFGALLFFGFWNKRLGILGALGSIFSFISTITIIPFIPNGWAPSAGGFPAMTETVAFLLKDLVLLVASVYLLRQDVMRISVKASTTLEPVAQLQNM